MSPHQIRIGIVQSYIRTNSGKCVRGNAALVVGQLTQNQTYNIWRTYIYICGRLYIYICAANKISIRNGTSWKIWKSKNVGKTQTAGSWREHSAHPFLLLSACSKLVWGVYCFRSFTKHGIWQLVGSVMPFSSVNLTAVSCHACCSAILPPNIGLREGGPKEKLVVEERFF